ncbi:3'-5' exonuclease [Vibrio parahaemolyticus]|uniref:3'-5' exonuclease n=1 Tax=Vibrio parahaemolyticus TaxID=670 RepID=UPI000405631E|nr:3'-5' exonuclease [Vibrio parahaemolyticus]EIA1562743.1 3'-5' exonuclease [Vibrio parahaemolyticus]MCS0085916.1 3'-5' exonuclease [Vibrio parahaemolyticus]
MEKLELSNAVILDTETTGLDSDARIVEITGICANTGEVLFNQLVNPLCAIPQEATAIHGITDSDVECMPAFDVVWNQIKGSLFDKHVLVYNFDYDYRLIAQSLSDFGYPIKNLAHMINGECVMLWYAEFYGELNAFYGNYVWQKLTNACAQQGVDISDLTAHRALGDCEMTRRLVHAVNAQIVGVA